MVNKILSAAGVPHRHARLTGKQLPTEATWLDDITATGSDDARALILRHDVTVELYEDRPDDESEAAIEDAIEAFGLTWTKQDRYWLQTEQRYQVLYSFTYFEKKVRA